MIYTPETKKAMKLCFDAHKDQTDKSGLPYVFHPFHVAEQMQDEKTTIVALLHDVIEDTDVTKEEQTTAEAGADEAVLKIKSLEAFEKVADGQATTILLPSDLAGIASMGVALEEGIKTAKTAKGAPAKVGECIAPHDGYEDCPQ